MKFGDLLKFKPGTPKEVHCGNVHNSDCGKIVHNFEQVDHCPDVTKKGAPKTGSLDWWRFRLEAQKEPWWKIEPFDIRNDPLFGIPANLRAKLVEEARLAIPDEPQVSSVPGIDFDEWNRLYVDEWYLEIQKRHPELFKAQADAVLMYSDRLISLRKNLHLSRGPKWKRGTRGNLLPERALDMLPTQYAEAFRLSLKKHDNILVHLEGTICSIQKEMIRYPKK